MTSQRPTTSLFSFRPSKGLEAFSSISEWSLCQWREKILISTLLYISTALDQWWTFTYFKRCDTSPGYWIKMIWVILVENFTRFPVVPCLWNFWSIISFSAPSQDLHAAVLRLDKWHKHRINSVPVHHSNCLLWSCHHLKALGGNHLMDKQLADVEPSEETG